MKVLILGGTGAMGKPLCKELSDRQFDVHVTSRSKHTSDTITYHEGDAHDPVFLQDILIDNYDAIVDFMSYTTKEFQERYSIILKHTDQYVFISSAKVYAPSSKKITEDSARLLDVCDDKEYLLTDEYALAKARQENLLFESGHNNYTIVRPSITYNNARLQYYLGEKEEWLFRYLNNKRIVMPQNCNAVFTTMSHGEDVSHAISLLIGNDKAKGEAIHIAGANAVTWEDVNNIYGSVLLKKFGRLPVYQYIEDWESIGRTLGKYYQMKYARGISRIFSNEKLSSIVGNVEFRAPQDGLTSCLQDFLDNGLCFGKVFGRTEAIYDKITNDSSCITALDEKERIRYYVARYTKYYEIKARLHM